MSSLRTIAEREIEKNFTDLTPTTRGDLVTSLIRQWIGNEGTALLLTNNYHYRFQMRRIDEDNTEVIREREPQTFVNRMRKSQVAESEIPSLLHGLNVRQTVECVTATGRRIRLRVDPRSTSLVVELVENEELEAA